MKHSPGQIHRLWNVATPPELVLMESNNDEAAILAVVNTSLGSGRSEEESEANGDRFVACWNACEGMEDPETEVSQLKQYDEPNMKCNKGHVTLPLKLWDCPACTEELRQEIAMLRSALERAKLEITDPNKGRSGSGPALQFIETVLNPRKSYKIKSDPTLNLSAQEQKTLYDRMARYGTWDGPWWTPAGSQPDPEKRIERDGYIIEETQP